MRWEKQGLLFRAEKQFPWMAHHAAQPFAQRIENDLYRIYFTARDELNRSHVGWIEIDITRPFQVLRISEAPLLAPGAVGAFDDAGAMMSCLARQDGKQFLFYTGWSLRSSVPYHWCIGLARQEGPGVHQKFGKLRGPIMDRCPEDPLLCASPYVIVEEGRWRMWYLSGLTWSGDADHVTPSYDMRYAESKDGVNWSRTGLVVMRLRFDELGFSRPSVISDGRTYRMWYSVRGQNRPYRLRYAYSEDGLSWTSNDDFANLEPSADGWDSEMIAYPHVFDHEHVRYMLYCGGGYGLTGFGLAVCA